MFAILTKSQHYNKQKHAATDAKESKLAERAMEMASIGYDHTQEQMSEMVKRLLDEDGSL